MTNWSTQIVQIHFASIPSESVVVAPVSDSFVESRVVFYWHPSHACQVDFATLEQLAFLNLQMNDSVLLIEAKTRNHPKMEI